MNSSGFPPVPASTQNAISSGSLTLAEGEVILLSERAVVLEVLFAFMHPNRHPDLEDKDFALVAEVAEAAEKYQVYPAMNVCRRRMRSVFI